MRTLRFFVLALLFPLTIVNSEIGNAYCYRCHKTIYEEWTDNSEKKSCESCHGIGLQHTLKPSKDNIKVARQKGFSHRGKGGAAKSATRKVKIELFVMSLCPYGIEAENIILPIMEKWREFVDFKLYHIAHERGRASDNATKGELPPDAGKCESSSSLDMDGTDKFVSLHGLSEVLEGIRQTVIQEMFPRHLPLYILQRNRYIREDWKKAARQSGMTDSIISLISRAADSKKGDSLFLENISYCNDRAIHGSPTIFINDREFIDKIDAYSIERLFCNSSTRNDTLCKSFPACGIDTDCKKNGYEGKCLNPRTTKAKCEFMKAIRFTVTILNDDTCRLCHTGNIVREIINRFPSAQFNHLDINSADGIKWINKYSPTAYPSFFFESRAEKSKKFNEIIHTFTKTGDQYLLNNSIVKTYHYINTEVINSKLEIIGSPYYPPFVEMVRNMAPLLLDTLKELTVYVRPSIIDRDDMFEDAEAKRIIAINKLPKESIIKYLLCRGNQLQQRFESDKEESANEWKKCAIKHGLDTTEIMTMIYTDNKTLLYNNRDDNPVEPTFVLKNKFRIQGYNSYIHDIIKSLLRQ